MSTLSFSTLQAATGSTIKIPYGQIFDIRGLLKIPNWTNSNRPSGVTGMFGFNTEIGLVEFYGENGWTSYGIASNGPLISSCKSCLYLLHTLFGASSI